MTKQPEERGCVEVITELYSLTKEMSERKDDADFLIASVENRQRIMDEYDALREQGVENRLDSQARDEINRMVHETLEMDAVITTALKRHRDGAKSELADSNNQQKVLGYVNQAFSSSGSYMDYKK